MLTKLIILALCLAEFASCTTFEKDDGIFVLNDKNYDCFLKKNPNCVILWNNPNCNVCKRFMREYIFAAENSELPFAKIDFTKYPDFAAAHDVDGYPSVFHHKDGEATEYHGELKAVPLLEYLHNNA